MDAYLYPIALAIISLFTLALEAIFPWREQPLVRRRTFLSDVAHLVFNGHFLGVLLFGIATHYVMPHVDRGLGALGWTEIVHNDVAATWPLWVQIPVALLAIDLAQWGIHVLLHRVPWLWELHKCHHSVVDGEMSWIVAFRFQWTEVVVYRALQYLPLAFFGFSPAAAMTHAIFGTLIGHLNHSNLRLDWGPLRYVFNSPRMHLWHHDYEGDAKTTVNYGVIFSIWDWLFGTAKLPERSPARLGFAGVEDYPTDFLSHAAWPLSGVAARRVRAAAPALGVGVLALGAWLHVGPARSTSQPEAPYFGEAPASTQPADRASALVYPASSDEAEAALAQLGRHASEAGYARPEHMVSAEELAAALGAPRLALLDVRASEDFTRGHVPTAQPVGRRDYSSAEPVPGLSTESDELQAMLRARGVDEGDVVVIYGTGPEPYRLWWTLRALGGFEARVLDGGLTRWKALGGAVAAGDPQSAAPGDVRLQRQEVPPRWAELPSGARLLDARSAEEFRGERVHEQAARGGHIPGAELAPYESMARSASDPRLLTPDALRERIDRLRIEPDEEVVTYCQSGTRSSVLYFALIQAGFDEDRLTNYDGSWAEYSRLDEPVETEGGACRVC